MVLLGALLILLLSLSATSSGAQTTPVQELLLTEIVVTPTGGEFVEIFNPTASAIDLSDYYLTDATFAGGSTYYYNIVTGTNAGGGGFGDFLARFPDGASIGAGEYQTIAMTGSTAFFAEYGSYPTYELFDDGTNSGEQLMREGLPGSINGQGGLTNGGEVVILFYWDGASDLVTDVDYALWGDTAEAVDKTGVAIDGPDADTDTSTYLPDTPLASQELIETGSHGTGVSWQREDLTEGTETTSGGNGVNGEDETSENLSATWCRFTPTPGAATVCSAPPVPEVSLNEIVVSTTSADREFFELAGSAGESLDGVFFLEVTNGGAIDTVIDLSGNTVPSDGFWLASSLTAEAVLGVTGDMTIADNTLTNSSQTYLLVHEFSGASGDDIDANDDGAIDNALWSTLLDSVAVIDDDTPLVYSSNVVGPDGSFLAPGGFRCPDTTGGWNMHAFSDITDYTAGTANACFTPAPEVSLNEIVVSTTSTDREFFEIAGAAGVSLNGVFFLEVTSGGTIDTVLDLSTGTIPSDGFWLAASPTAESVLGVTGDFSIANNTLTNSAQTYLLVHGFSGVSGDDIDANDDGSIDNALWSTLLDSVAVIDSGSPVVYSSNVVGPDGSFLAPGGFRCPDTTGSWNMHDFSDTTDYTAGTANACVTPAPEVALNEIVVSTTSTDREFFEIAGSAGGSLNSVFLLEVTSGGVIDTVLDLSGSTIPSDGFWLAASPTAESVLGVTGDFSIANNTFTNISQTYLLVYEFSGVSGDDIDSNDDGAIDNALWSALLDSVAIIDDDSPLVYSSNVVGPDGSFLAPGAFRCPDTTGDWSMHAFSSTTDYTAGTANNCAPPPPTELCGDTFTPIYTIQGSGMFSALDGTEVSTEGVVVGDFQAGKSGFYLQDAVGDSDAATSDGIFVFYTGTDVNVGDHVRVRGTVDEFFGLTEITSVSQFWSCGSGIVAPTMVTLPFTNVDALEAYEGMLITFPQTLYIAEYFNFDRFGEIVLSTDRQFQPTATYEPGSPESAMALDLNLRSRIKLDDGRGNQNPDPAMHPNGSVFNLDNLFRGGDALNNVTGVLDYNFGEYKVQLTQGADYVNTNPRTLSHDAVGGNLKVASFNVLNYFTTLDDGSCPYSGGCRGADDAEEFTRQRDKIISALVAIDADVVGLIEIENHPTDVSTADLVSGLNDVMGAGTYDYVVTGAIGTDAIKQAFIYKPASVSLVGSFAVLDDPAFTNPLGYSTEKSRPALAQTFMDNETGGIFTAVVNHLKSKGSSCADGDDDPEAGSCNLTRTLGAQALLAWLATDPTGSGDEDFLIIGDLNAYDKEDPIDALIDGGYTDLVFKYVGENAYSYVFDGQLGYLDHALANAGLLEETTGTTIWHINADEPDLIDYDTTFKGPNQDALYAPDAFRSSDHDPVIVGLDICDEIAPEFDELSVTPEVLWPVNHKYIDVMATVVVSDNFDQDPTITLISVTSNEPDDTIGDGKTVDDIVIVDDFHFLLRAERAGNGTGRIYTITYMVTDDCGNSTTQSVTVSVPLSQGKGN